jgi:hypothetical protein
MKQSTYKTTLEWLKANPSLDELCAKYPAEWSAVQSEISDIVGRGVAEELKVYLEQLSKLDKSANGKSKQKETAALSQFIRSRMAHESVKKLCLSTLAADTGVKKGKLRFNLFNGFIAQKLLFARALERKPVSLFWFRLLWPLVWQRKRLMPLVQPKGIYCFYSRELIGALADMIGDRSCLEIGAGDGTLTRFLNERGVRITATDTHGWNTTVQYPDWVVKLSAREALPVYKSEVVICSWPPAQNDFECEVFNTPSVQLYIVIGSRYQFAFGNWKDYLRQTTFELEEDKALGALLLPPELESAVYIFRRKRETS